MKDVQTYTIGNDVLKLNGCQDNDPRGLVFIYEQPHSRNTYVMGLDPTVGRTGWSRETRTQDDYKIDNGAISIWRAQPDGIDVQVAEYAAPIDAEELGAVANILGRLYAGSSDSGQALCIPEAYPGPGLLTIREMYQLGYNNFFLWKYLDSQVSQASGKVGFYSNRESVKYLWLRSSRHIHAGKVIPRSEHLVEEMRNCTIDPVKQWGMACYGKHDDRVRAMMLALWAIHDWSCQVDTKPSKVIIDNNEPNWQASDVSAEGLVQLWEERFNEILEAV